MVTSTSRDEARRPLPRPTPLSQPFWDATKEGKFLIQRCTSCKEYTWTPQMACRYCLTETLVWSEASGVGSIYTFVIIHKAAIPAFSAPYVLAVVDLAEGPQFFTCLTEVDPSEVVIGMPVEVAFVDVGPLALPYFRPSQVANGATQR